MYNVYSILYNIQYTIYIIVFTIELVYKLVYKLVLFTNHYAMYPNYTNCSGIKKDWTLT